MAVSLLEHDQEPEHGFRHRSNPRRGCPRLEAWRAKRFHSFAVCDTGTRKSHTRGRVSPTGQFNRR
jgi:hypothetical protein